MPPPSLVRALTVLPCALLLSACGTSFLAIDRQPDASLLLPCTDPVLAADDGSDNDIGAERIRVAQAYAACKLHHGALATFVRGRK